MPYQYRVYTGDRKLNNPPILKVETFKKPGIFQSFDGFSGFVGAILIYVTCVYLTAHLIIAGLR